MEILKKILTLLPYLWIGTSSALTLVPQNIDQLTDRSERIVKGTVLSVEEGKASPSNLPAMVTRIRVEESYKGASEKEVVVRQLAFRGPRGRLRSPVGFPRFTPGDRVIVFLPKTSSAGLASPVGMGQGVFRILGPKAESPVVNEYGNRTLLNSTVSATTRQKMTRAQRQLPAGRPQAVTVSQMKEFIRGRTGK